MNSDYLVLSTKLSLQVLNAAIDDDLLFLEQLLHKSGTPNLIFNYRSGKIDHHLMDNPLILYVFIYFNSYNCIRYLSAFDPQIIFDKRRRSILHFAALSNMTTYFDSYQDFIEHKDSDGNIPLFYAIQYGNLMVVTYYYKYSYDFTQKFIFQTNSQPYSGNSANFAAFCDHLEIYRFFITIGIDIDSTVNSNHSSFFFSVLGGSNHVFFYIIKRLTKSSIHLYFQNCDIIKTAILGGSYKIFLYIFSNFKYDNHYLFYSLLQASYLHREEFFKQLYQFLFLRHEITDSTIKKTILLKFHIRLFLINVNISFKN
jgi:hypothetical protein